MGTEPPVKVNVYYEESHPEGVADFGLLLLHGSGQSSEVWRLGGVMTSLASHGHRTVAIDLPGAGKTKVIEGLTGVPGRERYPVLLQSIIHEFSLERVVLVACDTSATHVLDYLNTNNNDGSDVMGCILCNPDLTDTTDVTLASPQTEVPILLLSEECESQIIHHPDSLREVCIQNPTQFGDSSELWPIKRPREFVERTLVFLSRLQTTEV